MKKIKCLSLMLLCSLAVIAQQEQNLLSGKLTVQELQDILIPQAKWTPFPRLNDRDGWAKADRTMLDSYIKMAETCLDYEWPTIPATLSLSIVRTGNRTQFEAISYRKRYVLGSLMMAELAENKGRFLDQIINGIWSICEESWWGSPAHLPKTQEYAGLMDVTNPFVDLFSAETGTYLAWADYFFGEKFDAISPQIRKRIYHEVNFRLFEPLINKPHWWMTQAPGGGPPLNWNPWICSNWINCALLLEKNDKRRAEMVFKAMRIIDNFLNPYNQDGGCDEGPSYWDHAAGSLFDNLALLNLASRDAFNYVFDNEKVKNMGRFIYRIQIGEHYFLNFADGDPGLFSSPTMIYRYGKAIHDRDMMDFAASFRHEPEGGINAFHYYRRFFALFMREELDNAVQRMPLPKDAWLPDLQVMIARDEAATTKGFFVGAKGGHNDESHNHNDVGNYVVFYNGQPLLIDIGRGTYTARTFNANRYDIWFNRSDYHNTPTINGFTQQPGKSYSAVDVRYQQNTSVVEFSLDIHKAYPPEAGVNSWKRTIKLVRGKGVQVKDVTNLQQARSVTQHLMTCYPAEILKPGELIIHYQPKDGNPIDFVVRYDPKQMQASVEKIKLENEEDRGIIAKWGDVIHRINFEAITPKTKDTYAFEISKK